MIYRGKIQNFLIFEMATIKSPFEIVVGLLTYLLLTQLSTFGSKNVKYKLKTGVF